MNFIKLISIIIIGAYLFSCQKEIDIDANTLPPKIVVDGTINTGEIPQVILRNSGFLYDTIDIEKTYIHGAEVKISDGANTTTLVEKCFKIYNKLDSLIDGNDTVTQNQFIFQLLLVEQEQMDSIYYYYFHISPEDLEESQLICVYSYDIFSGGIPLLGEEGKTYTLTVKDGEREVKAITTIPQRFEVDSMTYKKNPNDDNYADVFIHLTFPSNIKLGNYIQYGSKTQGKPFYYGMRTGSVYSDAAFVGSSSLSLPLEGRRNIGDDIPVGAERQFHKGDTVTLIWKNIDKASYDFLYTAENDGGSSPFSSPVKIISNVEGGLGLWAGYNVSYASVYIE